MRLRSSLVLVSLPLIAALAACGSSTSHDNGSGAGGTGAGSSIGGSGGAMGGGGGSVPVVPQAKSSLPRVPASQVPPASLAAAVTANNTFAVALYDQLRSGAGTSNLLTSPLSASLALTMTYAGAEGDTATEMAGTLDLGSSAQTMFAGQNALTQALDGRAAAALAGDRQLDMETGQPPPSPSNYELSVVNSVWGEQTETWNPSFLAVLAQNYGTGVYLQDFIHQPDQARQTINGWVSAETADKINDLLPPGSIDATTRMVLVNAIHLKLGWANGYTFGPTQTAPGTFTRVDGTTVSVPLMNQTTMLAYVDDGQAQIAALPLVGGSLAVVIALPHGDLATYEEGLTAGSAALSQPSTGEYVALTLPKVSFTSPTFSLANALMAMGMPQAFEPGTANFQGMTPCDPMTSACDPTLYINDVLQKTELGMMETGVEAAAATGVVVDQEASASSTGGPPPTPVPMVVNRPFLTAIVDAQTGAVLFLGHVVDPSAS